MPDTAQIFTSILDLVKTLDPANTRKWFDDLVVLRFAHGLLEIGCPDEATAQFLSDNCRGTFTKAAQNTTGHLVTVKFSTTAGPEKGYYILLLLNLEDDPDAYEGGLSEAARIILQNLEDDAYVQFVPSLFRRLTVYPTLNEEQRLAMTYQDEIKRMIINRLREEGAVSKSELMVWLKDKYKQGFVD